MTFTVSQYLARIDPNERMCGDSLASKYTYVDKCQDKQMLGDGDLPQPLLGVFLMLTMAFRPFCTTYKVVRT